MLMTWATTQTVVALSSGDAKYYLVANCMCEAVGIKGIAKDMSTDSSAAKGIATRRGLEKVIHLETRTLWAQDKIDEGFVVVKKIGGDRNVADILTKYFSSSRLRSLLADLPVTELEGRFSPAPQLQCTGCCGG